MAGKKKFRQPFHWHEYYLWYVGQALPRGLWSESWRKIINNFTTKIIDDLARAPLRLPPSPGHALFLCQDTGNTNEQALMRIHVQIPYAGSEFELPDKRALQASEEVNWCNESELHALQLSTTHRCKYLPTLLSFRKGSQAPTGLLPGGYISYLLMTNMPGIRLGTHVENDSIFWSLPRTERDDIRAAFKVAHRWVTYDILIYHIKCQPSSFPRLLMHICVGTNRDVLTIGILPEFCGLKNLLWEKESKKM